VGKIAKIRISVTAGAMKNVREWRSNHSPQDSVYDAASVVTGSPIRRYKKTGPNNRPALQLIQVSAATEGEALCLDLGVTAKVFRDFFPAGFDVLQSFIDRDFIREVASEFAIQNHRRITIRAGDFEV
jgi:hypothetical protein